MPSDQARYRASLQGEIDSATSIGQWQSPAEKNPQLVSVYVRLAEVEEHHLSFRVRFIDRSRPRSKASFVAGSYEGLSAQPVRPPSFPSRWVSSSHWSPTPLRAAPLARSSP